VTEVTDDSWTAVFSAHLKAINDRKIAKRANGYKFKTDREPEDQEKKVPEEIELLVELPGGIAVICEEKESEIVYAMQMHRENSPLLVLEIMERMHRTFLHFIKEVNEESIRANQVTLQLLLTEMLTGGIVSILETGVLEHIIPKLDSSVNKMISAVTDKILPDNKNIKKGGSSDNKILIIHVHACTHKCVFLIFTYNCV
jgi:hypothetical protein